MVASGQELEMLRSRSGLRVLGIDPGTIKTGYGVIERRQSRLIHIDNGVVRASSRLPLFERLVYIHEGLADVMARFQPDVVAVESIFTAKNVRSALSLGHARGVALLVAATGGADLAEYAPALVKKTVTGRGRADKLQVGMMVRTLLGLPEVPAEDAGDALALAICHCQHETERTIRDRLAARAHRCQS